MQEMSLVLDKKLGYTNTILLVLEVKTKLSSGLVDLQFELQELGLTVARRDRRSPPTPHAHTGVKEPNDSPGKRGRSPPPVYEPLHPAAERDRIQDEIGRAHV